MREYLTRTLSFLLLLGVPWVALGQTAASQTQTGKSDPHLVGWWKLDDASAKTADAQGEVISWGEDDFGKQWTLGFIRKYLGVTPNGGYLYMNDKIHDDQWHHVAAVVKRGDPPNLHDNVTLYLDGALATIHDIGLLDLWPIDTGSEMDVIIGRGFKGLLDDVRLYDRALSSEEMKALFEQK